MSNSRDQYNQDDVRVQNGHQYQYGSNHTAPIAIWNVTYTASDNFGMVHGRPVTTSRHDQDDVQMKDDSASGPVQASVAQDRVDLARRVKDCFEDIDEKNDTIAKLLGELRQRFLGRHYKSIFNNFTTERRVHQECLDNMKELFMMSSRTLPDSQDSQLLLDERGVSGLLQSLQSLEKNQRNLQRLIIVLKKERNVFGNQPRPGRSRATERTNQPRRHSRRQRRNTLPNTTMMDQYISQSRVGVIDTHLDIYKKQNLNIVEAMQDLATLVSDESESDTDDDSRVGLETMGMVRAAAQMLYQSLGIVGNGCPNTAHNEHHVCLGLDTWIMNSSVEFTLAFENTTEEEAVRTWFLVKSTCKELTTSSDSQKWTFSRLQAGRRSSLSSSEIEAIKNRSAAQFCLSNHRQFFNKPAIDLNLLGGWSHQLLYPSNNDVNRFPEFTHPGMITLAALLQKRPWYFRRGSQRVRLARLLCEAVLKFNAADWLEFDLNENEILIYDAQRSAVPHIRARLVRHISIESGEGMSQILEKLARILHRIAFEEEDLGPTYTEAVEACRQFADDGHAALEDIEDQLYDEVVRPLKELEDGLNIE